jgi:hypothetical protein
MVKRRYEKHLASFRLVTGVRSEPGRGVIVVSVDSEVDRKALADDGSFPDELEDVPVEIEVRLPGTGAGAGAAGVQPR